MQQVVTPKRHIRCVRLKYQQPDMKQMADTFVHPSKERAMANYIGKSQCLPSINTQQYHKAVEDGGRQRENMRRVEERGDERR